MPYCRQSSLTGLPASASLKMDTIWISVNFDWRMRTSWLEWLFCQKVLLLTVSIYGEFTRRPCERPPKQEGPQRHPRAAWVRRRTREE
jgi:hypothetical protein